MTAATTTPARRARRVFGMETEYGLTAARVDGAPTPAPDEELPEGMLDAESAARLLFRPVLTYRRSSNRYLTNGARLYLDVGDHPEYAGPECSDPLELLASDRAGEEILRGMVATANATLEERDSPQRISLFKNNEDSHGNSYGSHENYLVQRRRDFRAMGEALVSFLVTRQVLTGAGHVRRTEQGPRWSLSGRSDLMWDAMSGATTRSRPMINTRDEPHADASLYRRLHVIVGDSNVAQGTTLLKIAATSLVLDLLEDGVSLGDLRLAEPTHAIREVAHDPTLAAQVELESGARRTGLDLQEDILGRVLTHLDRTGARAELSPGFAAGLELWEHAVTALRRGDLDAVSGDLDWVAKMRLVERYRARSGAGLEDPRVARLLLAYHDVTAARPLARTLEERGVLRTVVDADVVERARTEPPTTTRAVLRGAAVAAADRKRRDLHVDWVQLRVDFENLPTVMLQDPFATQDPRVDDFVARLEALPDQPDLGPVTF